ncbi:cystatin-A1-like [Hyla sarda]|uniref:cystatin-A1-like n=1 Tax=Hyla sarda TaxID=327740 RepID=UPI0024C44499|nr:cystatin-A1-like [Hyla sarda]
MELTGSAGRVLGMEPPFKLGGVGETKPANPEVQGYCDTVKSKFLEQSGLNVTEFKADSYRDQVVAGMYYYIKVWLGGDKYCHIKVYNPLPHTGGKPELQGYKLDKSKEESIGFF